MAGQDDEGAPKDTDTGKQTPDDTGTGGTDKGGDDADPPGAEHLGDPGKKALETMKAERKAARDEAAKFKADLEALQAKVDGKEAEHVAELEKQRVQNDALSVANQRILKAELRAAAAGKLADPADALRFLDLDKFEVDTDGEVDTAAVNAALDELLKTKPYLAAQGGKRFQGSGDGGARNGSEPSIDDQIAAATKAGNLQQVIALKQKRSADLLANK
jgi:hypothetical protein